jgi:hypothetical protein
MRPTRLAAVALMVLAAGSAAAQETIENQEFKQWSKFKKGASVTMKSTTDLGKMKVEAVITTTLIDVGPDKLVLETSSVSKINGMEIKVPPMKRDVPKTVTVPKVDKKDDPKAEKPKTEEGTETLKVAGVEVKTKWSKATADVMGTKTEAQYWFSDDFPGGLVKSVTKIMGANPATITIEVTEFKKP